MVELVLEYHVAKQQVMLPECLLMHENANSCYLLKRAITDTTVNPGGGKVLPPEKEYSVVFFPFVILKSVSLCGNPPPCCRERFGDLSISQMAEH